MDVDSQHTYAGLLIRRPACGEDAAGEATSMPSTTAPPCIGPGPRAARRGIAGTVLRRRQRPTGALSRVSQADARCAGRPAC